MAIIQSKERELKISQNKEGLAELNVRLLECLLGTAQQ